MLRLIGLILPTIFPSWRFFKEVEASPRLEFQQIGEDADTWHPATKTVARVSPLQMLARLFWNRDWNEYLYLVSCCERLLIEPAQHSVNEITARLGRRHGLFAQDLSFRILLVDRDHGGISHEVAYLSTPPHVVQCPSI